MCVFVCIYGHKCVFVSAKYVFWGCVWMHICVLVGICQFIHVHMCSCVYLAHSCICTWMYITFLMCVVVYWEYAYVYSYMYMHMHVSVWACLVHYTQAKQSPTLWLNSLALSISLITVHIVIPETRDLTGRGEQETLEFSRNFLVYLEWNSQEKKLTAPPSWETDLKFLSIKMGLMRVLGSLHISQASWGSRDDLEYKNMCFYMHVFQRMVV